LPGAGILDAVLAAGRVLAMLGCLACVLVGLRSPERLERLEWLAAAILLAVLAK